MLPDNGQKLRRWDEIMYAADFWYEVARALTGSDGVQNCAIVFVTKGLFLFTSCHVTAPRIPTKPGIVDAFAPFA